MSQAVTLRLPEQTAEAIRCIAQRERRSLSDVGACIIEEWKRQNRGKRGDDGIDAPQRRAVT